MASRSRAGSICEQPGDFQLNRNSLYGKICSGKGVRNNREFITPVFVICMNTYNGKDRKKLIRCIRVRYKHVALYIIKYIHKPCHHNSKNINQFTNPKIYKSTYAQVSDRIPGGILLMEGSLVMEESLVYTSRIQFVWVITDKRILHAGFDSVLLLKLNRNCVRGGIARLLALVPM